MLNTSSPANTGQSTTCLPTRMWPFVINGSVLGGGLTTPPKLNPTRAQLGPADQFLPTPGTSQH